MKPIFRILVVLFLLANTPVFAKEDLPYEKQPGNSINEISLPLTKQSAAELAKVETDGKVLSVERVGIGRNIIFKVKVLHKNGNVKSHRFIGETGRAIP
jgi:hypothetical protein